MEIDAEGLTDDDAYKLLVGAVVPRPIAWVTTLDGAGRVNAAPFSAFTFVCNQPPMLAISIGRKRGALKDTARNIRETAEFVVNIADDGLIEPLHLSSREYPETVSEVEALGLATAPSRRVRPPRLAAVPVAMECRLFQTLEFGAGRSNLFIGEVTLFHVRDDLFRDGKIDSARLRPIARLGGPNYAKLGEIVTMEPVFVSPRQARGG
jgi:flavin reductase (DIM6/NTAB) family NADH-FMN oxidoreductase RutF